MKALIIIFAMTLSSLAHAAKVGDFATYDVTVNNAGATIASAVMKQTILAVDTSKNEYQIETQYVTSNGTSHVAQVQSPIVDTSLTTKDLCSSAKGTIVMLTTGIGEVETCYVEFNNGEAKEWLVAGFPTFVKSIHRQVNGSGAVIETTMVISGLMLAP